MVKERPYDHSKGSGGRGDAWKAIALTLTGEFEQKVSDRAVREHTEDLLESFKSEESKELRGSGIVPEYTEKKRLLNDISNMERDSPAQEGSKKRKEMEEKKILATELRKKACQNYAQKSTSKKTKLGPLVSFLQEKVEKDRELKEREIIALESKNKSPDTNTADLLMKQQQQFLDSMSQQHKEMHTLMTLQHENFMTALTQSQQQITALVESQRQMHELLKLTLGMQQRP